MLFTTLIPVYKTQFLSDIISCLNAQTCKEFQVIFSDDSPTKDLEETITNIQIEKIVNFSYQVIQGKGIGPVTNCHDLLKAWNGSTPYLHFFFDDDLIFPNFYQSHLSVYQRTQAKACISSRIIVDQNKTPQFSPSLPAFLEESNACVTLLSLKECIQSSLPFCDNWLGELSCATFDGHALQETKKGYLYEVPYYGINDLGLFIEMLEKHAIYYIKNNLGAFRINRWQTSSDKKSKIFQLSLISWASLIFDANQKNWISDEQCRHGIKICLAALKDIPGINNKYDIIIIALEKIFTSSIAESRKEFTKEWLELLNKNDDFKFDSMI